MSSPLRFPSGSPARSQQQSVADDSPAQVARQLGASHPSSSSQRRNLAAPNATSSPLNLGFSPVRNRDPNEPALFAPGSAERPRRAPASGSSARLLPRAGSNGHASSEPLFFPASPDDATPRKGRARGDIHSSRPPSTPNYPSTRRQVDANNPPSTLRGISSEGGNLGQGPPDGNPPSQGGDGGDGDPTSDADGPRRVLWGTYVGMDDAMTSFRDFLTNFKLKDRFKYDAERRGQLLDDLDPEQEAAGERTLYEQYLRTMRQTGQTNLNLDMSNLAAFKKTRKLERWLRLYPHEIVPMCDQVLKECVLPVFVADAHSCMVDLVIADAQSGLHGEVPEEAIDEVEGMTYKIRPFGSTELGREGERRAAQLDPRELAEEDRRLSVNMRDLNPADIDKLVTIKGLVIRATPIIPDMKTAFFRCLGCSHTLTVENDRAKIAEPERCPRDVCGLQGSMSLVHNRSEFADRQVIRLQETPDVVPDGQTPHTVSLCVYDELVDSAKPGDRVSVTGIFRSVPVRVNPRQRSLKALFKTYVDVLHLKKSDARRLGVDQSTRDFSGAVGVGGEEEIDEIIGATDPAAREQQAAQRVEQERKLVELSNRPDIYDLLSRSLAPSIWEVEDVKKGILLQLFGGTNKTIGTGGGQGGPRYRGDINVLLVGDPGTAKSQLLQYVHKIAPRGVYTSGKGSSAVGLTAYVTRDPDSKQLVLESGALVLSDGGVCCIDEFDKMSDATRSILHEVMEQQTVSIAKAGIITTLNARTSILAAANPVGSKYNLNWPITKNIDLPPTLISRFDLLYLVLDRVDETLDRKLAKHLVGLYLEDRPDNALAASTEVLALETLTQYISYARNRIHPVLTQPATDLLVATYVSMRQAGTDTRTAERRITATTRQLESMIRLSEAHARMRFSDRVEAQDVEEAARLIREALKESATDPLTGLLDLDLLNTGQGQQERKLAGDLRRELIALLESQDPNNRGIRWSELYTQLDNQSSVSIDRNAFAEAIKGLETENQIKITGAGERRSIRRQL